MDWPRLRTSLVLYGGVLLGAGWVIVALLSRFQPSFILYDSFRDLGLPFWAIFTLLGLVLVGTLSWAGLTERPLEERQAKAAASSTVDPVKFGAGWNPSSTSDTSRSQCARCSRTLPIWRIPEGTCTVCAPFSVFLDKPRRADPELEKRRNRLFLLQGLGLALLALAFVSAVYLFPIVLAPQRPVLATLAFLVFSPMVFGLVLLAYAQSHHVPERDA